MSGNFFLLDGRYLKIRLGTGCLFTAPTRKFNQLFCEHTNMDLPKLPTGVVRRRTSSAGTGLFASETIKAGEEILRVQRPYALAVDSDRLHDTCASCCLFLSSEETIQQIAQEDDDRERRLSFCLGCKIVKYCSKVNL